MGITRTVADRARVPIIGDKYGLPPYFVPVRLIDSVVDRTVDRLEDDVFRHTGRTNAAGSLRQSRLIPTRLLTVVAADV